jgi:hypothetical protein
MMWTDRYEAIRRQVLGAAGHGGGLALLLRCGLVTWLRAGPGDAGDHADQGTARQQLEPSGTPELPGELAQEITRILVNMFLDQNKETSL